MNRFYVSVIATLFILYGIAFLLFPSEVLYLVVQGSINSTSGLTDLRATYGGLTIAVGVILLLLAKHESTIRIGLISVFVLMVGMAIGRLVGIIMDGQPNMVMVAYLASEVLAALLSLWLYKRS